MADHGDRVASRLGEDAGAEGTDTVLREDGGLAAGERFGEETHPPSVAQLLDVRLGVIVALPREPPVIHLVQFRHHFDREAAARGVAPLDGGGGLAGAGQRAAVERTEGLVRQGVGEPLRLAVAKVRERVVEARALDDAFPVEVGLAVPDQPEASHRVPFQARRDKPSPPAEPVRKVDLERALEAVPRHPSPDADLEQYRTPAGIAAELLLAAQADGAIPEKRVLDLGCGTGTFTVGAARLGARLATGVEVDSAALALAHESAAAAGVANRCWFVAADLAAWHPEPGAFDTVVMNPPFGAQKGNKHADRLFLDRAAEAVKPGGTVWFLALERTERFLATYAKEMGGRLERVAAWDYPLEATMAHHKQGVAQVRVGGYRLAWR